MSETEDPTPEEIAAECARIRATWTPDEEAKRRVWSVAPPVSAPVVRIATLAPAMPRD